MYTSVSSFYTLSLHDALPISGRHDLERHPRGVHQHARLSDAAVGDVEVSRAGPAAGGGRAARDARAGEDHRTRAGARQDRKSTRLNSSHTVISYAVFCLKKKK